MSFNAVEWALAQSIERSSAKFVLVAMASCVNGKHAKGEPMTCFPSTAHLCKITSQDRKTVLGNIKILKDLGYVVATEDRAGRTGQILIYVLKSPVFGTASRDEEAPGNSTESGTLSHPASGTENGPLSDPPNDTKNGTVKESQKRNSTENGTVPLFPSNSTVFPGKESQISHETVPKTGHVIRKEKGIEKGKKKEEGERAIKNAGHYLVEFADLLVGVDPQHLADWLKVRKAKRAGELTSTALRGVAREAAKAGLTVARAIEVCAEAGWQGFEAAWYANRIRGNTLPARQHNGRPIAHMGTDQRNYEEGFDEQSAT